MGHWQDKLVYIQDFAYPPRSLRLRMDNGNIGDAPAQTFAEYVQEPTSMFDSRLLSGPLVDIYVGEAKRHWSLHRNLLCHHSAYLSNELLSLSGEEKESEATLELPDDDPAGFELLVKWLYQGRIEDVSTIADPQRKYEFAAACHKLYLLCDRFDISKLKNHAIDQYRKGLQEAELVPDADEVNDIYRASPPGSPFRMLMVQIAARQIMDPENKRSADSYQACFENNPGFAIALVDAIKSGTGGMLFEDPTDGDRCVYHDHSSYPSCNAKKRSKQGSFPSTFRLAQPPVTTRITSKPRKKTTSPSPNGANGDINSVGVAGNGTTIQPRRDPEPSPSDAGRRRSSTTSDTANGRAGSESLPRRGEGDHAVERTSRSTPRRPPKLRVRGSPSPATSDRQKNQSDLGLGQEGNKTKAAHVVGGQSKSPTSPRSRRSSNG